MSDTNTEKSEENKKKSRKVGYIASGLSVAGALCTVFEAASASPNPMEIALYLVGTGVAICTARIAFKEANKPTVPEDAAKPEIDPPSPS